MSERRLQLVLIAKPFTRSPPARIQQLTRHKPLFGLNELLCHEIARPVMETIFLVYLSFVVVVIFTFND